MPSSDHAPVEPLKLRADQLLRAVEDAAVGVLQTDAAGRMRSFNPHWCRMLGYAPHELVERTVFDVTAPESVAMTRGAFEAMSREKTSVALLKRYRRKDETILHALSHVTPMYGPSDEFLGATVFVVDQTAQVSAIEAARAAEERLQDALSIGQLLAWEWDLRDGTSIMSPDAESFWGVPIAGVEDFLDRVHPDDRAAVNRALQPKLTGTVPFEVQYRMFGADGTLRWMQARRRLERDRDGAPLRVRGITADITSAKRGERALRVLAAAGATLGASLDYETTLANLARVLVPELADWYSVDLLDAHGDLERVSVHHPDPEKVELAKRIHERYPPRRDLPTGTWHTIRTGEPSWMAHIPDDVLERGATDREHLALLRSVGLSSFMCLPLKARGQVIGIITLVYAESARRYTADELELGMQVAERAAVAVDNARLLRALQNADRRKDEFLAMLAHELRNPLAPVSMAAELLKVVAGDNAQAVRAAQIIARQVSHMTELVDDLLDVSRVTRGLVALQKQPVDVKSVVSAAVEQAQSLIGLRRHRLRTRIAPAPLVVIGDRARLIQVLVNLLNNAAKYTPEGGEIELSVDAEARHVRIRVQDNGAGIDPALMPHVFDLFTQGDRTPDRSQGGLGIGLALVRSITRLHGGDVHATSEGVGQGSTFTVLIPQADEATEAAPPATLPSPAKHGARRVLVVDDNQDGAVMVSEVLRLHGFIVDVAFDPNAALDAAIAGGGYDAYVLDLGLPGMSGSELAAELKARAGAAQSRFIALTGYGLDADRASTASAGFHAHLVKPADTSQLLVALGSDVDR